MDGLKRLRRERLLTQGELAAQVGVTVQAVQYWEAGGRYPRPSQQRALCAALGVTPAELLRALDASAAEGKPAA
jgi:transcriptional regulator with XRE-family HTH domain